MTMGVQTGQRDKTCGGLRGGDGSLKRGEASGTDQVERVGRDSGGNTSHGVGGEPYTMRRA